MSGIYFADASSVRMAKACSLKKRTAFFLGTVLLCLLLTSACGYRTHYRIVNQADNGADATLRGTVLSTATSPLTYDSTTGRASSVLVVVTMKVSFTDRQGKVLYENPAYLFREQYQVSRELNSFFEEDSPALQRLSREFARTLVSNILEGF